MLRGLVSPSRESKRPWRLRIDTSGVFESPAVREGRADGYIAARVAGGVWQAGDGGAELTIVLRRAGRERPQLTPDEWSSLLASPSDTPEGWDLSQRRRVLP